jgi:fructan beta-fructosidase
MKIKACLIPSFLIFLFGILISSCGNSISKDARTESPVKKNYSEKYRPQFHFSPASHWMNDPNGLVYLDGEYHLFYQYYPDSSVWGPMHWGHTVSRDLIHWENLPVALYPDSLGYIFSGSAVIDTKSSSGLGTVQNPPMVAIFTYHNPFLEKKGSNIFQNQGMAYSIDKGRTFTKYAANPVLKNPGIRDFRDPKVFRYNGTGKWIMIMAVHDRVNIYSSPDLINWNFESEFGKNAGAHGGVWECPDLFQLNVEGKGNKKWTMLVSINPGGPNGGSATQYFTGEFDGHRFVPDNTNEKWVDWGRDNYAGVTWSDIPEKDGRRLFIGWMSNWDYATVIPTTVWRSASTLPRELSLTVANNEYYLKSKPVRETEILRKKAILAVSDSILISGEKVINTDSISLNRCELIFDFNLNNYTADSFGISLENKLKEKLNIGYSVGTKKFYVDRRNAGNSSFSGKFSGNDIAPYTAASVLKLHLFIDASSTELFIDDGKLVMTNLVFPSEDYTILKLFSKGGTIKLDKAILYPLESIWH